MSVKKREAKKNGDHIIEYNWLKREIQRMIRRWVFVRKISFWLFKIFEIQKGRTFSFNDILRLCTTSWITRLRPG